MRETMDVNLQCTGLNQQCGNQWNVVLGNFRSPTFMTFRVADIQCCAFRLRVSINGSPGAWTEMMGWPGAPAPFDTLPLAIGPITLEFSTPDAPVVMIALMAEGVVGGCDQGTLPFWAGTLEFFDELQDVDAPITVASLTPVANTAGWNSAPVTVNLVATDVGGSAVREIRYELAGAQVAQATVPGDQASVLVSNAGRTTVTFFAIDEFGNQESPKTVQIDIDAQVPVTTTGVAPAANAAGWHRGDVNVTLNAADAPGSGVKELHIIAPGTGEAVVPGAIGAVNLVNEGDNQMTFFAVDVAGNQEAPRSIDVKIDRTAPETLATLSAEGPSSVRVTLQATDGLSGVKEIRYECSGAAPGSGVLAGDEGSFVVSSAGTTSVSFFAVDVADNQETPKSVDVVITLDPVAPATTAELSPVANPAGWNQADVQVVLTATDGDGTGVREIRYQVDGGAEVTVAGAAANFAVVQEGTTEISFFAVDTAGNQESPKSVTVKIDRSVPAVAGVLAPAANPAGWCRANAVVTLDATDLPSDIAEIRCVLSGAQTGPVNAPGAHCGFTVQNEGTTTASFFAIDVAGNASAPRTLDVKIDKTPPVITFTGNAGTYTVDQNVNISCQVLDPLSGVASATTQEAHGPAYSFPLGANVLNSTATDVAGNAVSGATTFTVRFTWAGFRALIGRFVTRPAVRTLLLLLIDRIEAAIANHNAPRRRRLVAELKIAIANQRGRAISRANADILLRLLRTR